MNTKKINRLVDSVKLLLIIAIAFVIVALIVFACSEVPGEALYNFFIGPFLSPRRIGNIVEGACPLIFTSLAVMLIFSVGQFSMISEGSFFIGCTAAMVISLSFQMPAGIHAAVCLIVAAVSGALVASIPALLKKKWTVSEVVTSIMLNYVVQYFAVYLLTYYYNDKESSSVTSLPLAETTALPKIVSGTNIHFGLIIALACCVLVWFIMYRSNIGFKLRVTGHNPSFAHYVGMNEGMLMVGAQILAGALAGLGGAVELLGMYQRFKWTSSPGYGWTGIVVALLAKDNPLMIPLAACFIAYINTGANIMAMNSDVSNDMASVIQAVIMLLIASGALLQKWRQKLIVEAAEKEQAEADAAAANE